MPPILVSPAFAPGVITFEELCVFALARLPERLRRLRVPAADVGDLVHDVVLVAHPKLGQFQPRRLGSEAEIDVARALLAWLVFYWQMSSDNGKSWVSLPSTGYAHTELVSPGPGTYQFRASAMVGKTLVDPTQPFNLTIH